MYSLGGYGSMIADRVRVDAYSKALRKTVHEGSVVVEIGTGPGIFAVLACQLGASRVFAIEPAEIIQVAREIAAANGCSGKIEFFEELSNRVTVPVRADVVVSDLRGVLPFFQRHIPSIVDARKRLLAPGGIMIPRKDTLWAAIAEAPKPYGEVVGTWEKSPFGQDLSPARRLAVNNNHKIRVSRSHLLAGEKLWTTLDYASVEDADVRSSLQWTVERAGTGHGIIVWFDADLAEGAGFSNSPHSPETIYGSLFFPWTQPVALASGQRVCMQLEARLVEEDYVWRWTTDIEPFEKSDTSIIHFEQSQLNGAVMSAAKLFRMAADYVPCLSEEGRLSRRTLELMNGKLSLEEIGSRLAEEFPERFPDLPRAMSYAAALSQEYSR